MEGSVFLQDPFAVGEIFVLEHLDGGFRKTRAIDDGGVVQLVGNDQVVLAKDGGNRAGVRGKTRLKDDRGFHLLEPGDCSSRSMCSFMVPAMVRTAPAPTPNFRIA